MRGKRESRSKQQRRIAKFFARRRKRQRGLAKPSGTERDSEKESTKFLAKQHKSNFVELKKIGEFFFPNITMDAWAKLKKRESTSVGNYCFIVDRVKSTENIVICEVCIGMDLTSKKKIFLGKYFVNVENKTVRKLMTSRLFDEKWT